MLYAARFEDYVSVPKTDLRKKSVGVPILVHTPGSVSNGIDSVCIVQIGNGNTSQNFLLCQSAVGIKIAFLSLFAG